MTDNQTIFVKLSSSAALNVIFHNILNILRIFNDF